MSALRHESTSENNDETEKYKIVSEQYDSLKQKIQAIRLKIAKKNREISLLQRKLDEIPSRAELSQYQKRFVELYNQSNLITKKKNLKKFDVYHFL